MSDSTPTSIPSLFLINSDVLNPMKVLVDTAGVVTKKGPEEKSERNLLSPETGQSRSHSGHHRKERRREKSPGPSGQRSLLKPTEEPGRMSRRKSETLLFSPGGGKGGAREEKRREVKPRPRSGGRQRERRLSDSLVVDQAGSSLNTLTLGSLNKSSRDLRSAATGLETLETGHQDLLKYFEPETPDLHLNMLNCPNDSTLQCHCGHINCPCCNLLINLEITDPNILQ